MKSIVLLASHTRGSGSCSYDLICGLLLITDLTLLKCFKSKEIASLKLARLKARSTTSSSVLHDILHQRVGQLEAMVKERCLVSYRNELGGFFDPFISLLFLSLGPREWNHAEPA